MMYSNLCLSFRETVPLMHWTVPTNCDVQRCTVVDCAVKCTTVLYVVLGCTYIHTVLWCINATVSCIATRCRYWKGLVGTRDHKIISCIYIHSIARKMEDEDIVPNTHY